MKSNNSPISINLNPSHLAFKEELTYFDSILAIAASTAALLGFSYAIMSGTRSILSRTILSRKHTRSLLDQLELNLNLEYVEQIFGKPRFKRVEGQDTYFTFHLKHALVSVAVDRASSVTSFAITVTDHKLRYQISRLGLPAGKIALGYSNFSMRLAPTKAALFHGKRAAWYSEHYTFPSAISDAPAFILEGYPNEGGTPSPQPPTGSPSSWTYEGPCLGVRPGWENVIAWARNDFVAGTLIVPGSAEHAAYPKPSRDWNETAAVHQPISWRMRLLRRIRQYAHGILMRSRLRRQS